MTATAAALDAEELARRRGVAAARARQKRRTLGVPPQDMSVPPARLDTRWMSLSLCSNEDIDTEIFFPDHGDAAGAKRACAVCRGCPVRVECVDYALRTMLTSGDYGIYGGTSPQDRQGFRGRVGHRRDWSLADVADLIARVDRRRLRKPPKRRPIARPPIDPNGDTKTAIALRIAAAAARGDRPDCAQSVNWNSVRNAAKLAQSPLRDRILAAGITISDIAAVGFFSPYLDDRYRVQALRAVERLETQSLRAYFRHHPPKSKGAHP